MTTAPTPPAGRPLSCCPARHGSGADIADPFTFAALDDEPAGDEGQLTQVFAYFHDPATSPEDCLLTPGFDLPAASPVARFARRIAASPALSRAAGDALRAAIAACPCAVAAKCPALDQLTFIAAIRAAAMTRLPDPSARPVACPSPVRPRPCPARASLACRPIHPAAPHP
jgi:hypothetical protein